MSLFRLNLPSQEEREAFSINCQRDWQFRSIPPTPTLPPPPWHIEWTSFHSRPFPGYVCGSTKFRYRVKTIFLAPEVGDFLATSASNKLSPGVPHMMSLFRLNLPSQEEREAFSINCHRDWQFRSIPPTPTPRPYPLRGTSNGRRSTRDPFLVKSGDDDPVLQHGGGVETTDIETIQENKNIIVVEKLKSQNTHFNYTQLEIEFQLKKPENSTEGENWMEDAFDEMLKIVHMESKDGDKIVMKLFLRDNPNHRPIFIGIRPLSALNVPLIFAHLEKVQQSTTVFHSTDVLGVRAYLLHAMVGRGRHRDPSRMTAEEVQRFKCKSMIDVRSKKNCLPIAIILEITDSGFNLRSAVYGGRTEVFRLYHKCKPGDRIYYYDFTSLYPWANKYSKYFVGHPTIHKDIESQEEALKYDGVIKCKVLPPRGLYIPCLPYRCNNRLTFPLCRRCTENLNIFNCTHSDDERALTGFWSLDEVRLAVEHGYKIQKCFELWAYETSQYNRETGERGLFADYVDNFLKIKQESSGWPKDAKSDADKERYILEYLEKEGIQLEKDKIAVNKGMRSLSKIVLNSLWGRFIMREDYSKTTICNSSSELNDILQSENIEILDLYPAGPTQIFVSWKHIDEHEVPSKYVNLGVGICTTTNARIKLYSVLSKLGRNVFYCDTDSVIYLVPNGQENPLETGKFLGELTDELTDFSEGSYIDEFVSCGPKAYGLKIYSPGSDSYSYKVVFKGISMNREVEKQINFETLKNMVMTENDGIRVEYPDRITRQQLFQIQSGPCTKTANFTLMKRKCVENFDSLPFGY
uniref:DNA-directed DNA polymerase n=1 Tax=Lutzomyia longipalpis TaxID=7200 RepID=A0A1B0CJT2_LUTLO